MTTVALVKDATVVHCTIVWFIRQYSCAAYSQAATRLYARTSASCIMHYGPLGAVVCIKCRSTTYLMCFRETACMYTVRRLRTCSKPSSAILTPLWYIPNHCLLQESIRQGGVWYFLVMDVKYHFVVSQASVPVDGKSVIQLKGTRARFEQCNLTSAKVD